MCAEHGVERWNVTPARTTRTPLPTVCANCLVVRHGDQCQRPSTCACYTCHSAKWDARARELWDASSVANPDLRRVVGYLLSISDQKMVYKARVAARDDVIMTCQGPGCGKQMRARRKSKRWCGDRCRNRAAYEKRRARQRQQIIVQQVVAAVESGEIQPQDLPTVEIQHIQGRSTAESMRGVRGWIGDGPYSGFATLADYALHMNRMLGSSLRD